VSLPKPVIVVLVIVLVLAVAGCGMTVLGASQQDSNADPPIADLRGSNFTKFFQIFSPPSKEIGPGDFTTNCGTSDPGLLAVVGLQPEHRAHGGSASAAGVEAGGRACNSECDHRVPITPAEREQRRPADWDV